MAKIDKIKQALREISPEEKLHLWNLRCSEGGYQDDQIYENDEEFFNMYYANDIMGAVQAAVNGDYNFSHDYVTFNGYGNLQSIRLDRLDNFIDDKEIAEFLNENEEYLDELEVEDEEKNEVSEEEYWDNLEVLPPYYFNSINGKKVSGGFAVGEPTNHVKTPLGYRATYSGFYKKDGKYFGVGQVYFVFADEQGEPNDEGSGNVEVKTLNPDAFAKGGGIFSSLFSNREYSTGRNWTNDHRHQNKSEKHEVPMANRKSKYATGGGLGKPTYIPNEDIDSLKTTYGQTIAGKKLLDGAYATGKVKKPTMARTQFEEETYEYEEGGQINEKYNVVKVFRKSGRREILEKNLTREQAQRVVARYPNSNTSMVVFTKMYATGGGLKKPTYIPNADIDSLKTTYGQTIAGKKLLDGAYATGKVKKPTMARMQFEDETYEYAKGGFVSKGELVWKKLTNSKKADFLNENFTPQITPRSQETLVGKSWNFLPKEVKIIFQSKYANIENYGTGGTMDSSTFKKGGYTPKEPIAFKSSNLYFNGYAMDINGNSVVRVSFPSGRAFSIQTNGNLPETNNAYGTINFDEKEINAYVKAYGSPAQKKKLKIYKK